MNGEIILFVGYPASGKSTEAQKYIDRGYYNLNRDKLGGSLKDINKRLEELIVTGTTKFVLDNTYPTKASRKPIIELGQKYGLRVVCLHETTSIENSQFNAALRIIKQEGRLLNPDEITKSTNPKVIPAAAIFNYRRKFQKPEESEGFDEIKKVRFKRKIDDTYVNRAIFFDYDSIRETKSGRKYPIDKNDIVIKPGRQAALSDWKAKGYKLFGISNQSGIGKEMFTELDATALFEYTNELLDNIVDGYKFCPHDSYPIQCHCKKPMPGIGVEFIEKYKLDPADCYMIVGETADNTFAKRCGFSTLTVEDFFGEYEEFETQGNNNQYV